jgi:hypothetical protein
LRLQDALAAADEMQWEPEASIHRERRGAAPSAWRARGASARVLC